MNYATPLLSLLWLTLIGNISVREPALLVMGAAVIVGANVLANRSRTKIPTGKTPEKKTTGVKP